MLDDKENSILYKRKAIDIARKMCELYKCERSYNKLAYYLSTLARYCLVDNMISYEEAIMLKKEEIDCYEILIKYDKTFEEELVAAKETLKEYQSKL